MISEQSPTQTLNGAVHVQAIAEAGAVINVASTRFTVWQARLQVVAAQARAVGIAVLETLAARETTWDVESERRGPIHQRLGPGLRRESDSFWALSEWW
jgi:hypothetical protein